MNENLERRDMPGLIYIMKQGKEATDDSIPWSASQVKGIIYGNPDYILRLLSETFSHIPASISMFSFSPHFLASVFCKSAYHS